MRKKEWWILIPMWRFSSNTVYTNEYGLFQLVLYVRSISCFFRLVVFLLLFLFLSCIWCTTSHVIKLRCTGKSLQNYFDVIFSYKMMDPDGVWLYIEIFMKRWERQGSDEGKNDPRPHPCSCNNEHLSSMCRTLVIDKCQSGPHAFKHQPIRPRCGPADYLVINFVSFSLKWPKFFSLDNGLSHNILLKNFVQNFDQFRLKVLHFF